MPSRSAGFIQPLPSILRLALAVVTFAVPTLRADTTGEDTVESVVSSAAPVSPERARALAAAEIGVWRERISEGRPRVYFTPKGRAALRARRADAQGRERELFDAVVERARDIASRPAPPYRPPAEFVSAKISAPSAEAELWQRPIGDDLVTLSLALALEDDEAFAARLREHVLAVCAYPTWGRGSNGGLACSHVVRGVSIARDWHPSLWSEANLRVITETIRRHAGSIAEGLHGKAFWARLNDNNHNHVNAGALGIAGLAFLDEIPEAAEWLAAARLNFERALPDNSADGSTPEGVSYWVYSLNFILQYIECTRRVAGTAALYDTPFLRAAADFRIHASTSGFGAPLPWGAVGGSANAGFILAALAREHRSAAAQYVCDALPFRLPSGVPIDTVAWLALWRDPSLVAGAPIELDHHFTAADIVTTRGGWSADDYVLSVKSGMNNRNHGHLDAGALALAYGDQWLLTAPRYGSGKSDGTGGYWDRTTGRRWTYFSCSSESHSTLLVEGLNQRADRSARGTIDGFASQGAWCWTSVDLTEAYQGVGSVRREVLHRRGDYVLVFDHLKLAAPGTVEWLAQTLPGAVAEGPRLEIPGKAGSLEIRALVPADAAFAPRKANSPHYDVPANRLESFSLKQRAREVRYVVALLPAPKDRVSPVREIKVAELGEGFAVLVRGEGWTDRVDLAGTRVSAKREAGADSDRFSSIRRREPKP